MIYVRGWFITKRNLVGQRCKISSRNVRTENFLTGDDKQVVVWWEWKKADGTTTRYPDSVDRVEAHNS